MINVIHAVLADHSLFINCGGQELEFDGNKYEEDTSPGGKAQFFVSQEKWAYSTTGVFVGERSRPDTTSTSLNGTYPTIYETARLSPLSLKYYGLCLREGSYKVQLHFAEIIFSDDQTFSSLGKRIFDVSIQVSKCRFDIVRT